MKFFNRNKKNHTHNHEITCGSGGKRRFNFIKKNDNEFYYIPSIRLTLSDFKGDSYKGKYLGNGFKKLKFSLKFLNFINKILFEIF